MQVRLARAFSAEVLGMTGCDDMRKHIPDSFSLLSGITLIVLNAAGPIATDARSGSERDGHDPFQISMHVTPSRSTRATLAVRTAWLLSEKGSIPCKFQCAALRVKRYAAPCLVWFSGGDIHCKSQYARLAAFGVRFSASARALETSNARAARRSRIDSPVDGDMSGRRLRMDGSNRWLDGWMDGWMAGWLDDVINAAIQVGRWMPESMNPCLWMGN